MSWFLPLVGLWAACVALVTVVAVLMRIRLEFVRPHLKDTTGVVVEQRWVRGDESDPEGYVPTLEFTIETGRLVRAKAKGKPKSFPPEEGVQLPVLYRRDRPDTWCYLGNLADYESEATVGVGEMFVGMALTGGVILGLIGLFAFLWG
ncbi:DUF3592 domain-containing protein [Streptomyces sp. NBC_00986]|uniref:DUF3592 domain-containing protein n=1 Tax=Streptomyces sp. NBC_00986 TaxID=2903702 RepID=UPI00386404EB|nr:DUF3592 domain-containing protein [Streptomyces sp. NBC_00986]